MLCSPSQAEDWTALVVGNTSRNAPSAFADSFNVAQSLTKAGIGTVDLKREVGVDQMARAFDALSGQPKVLVYFAGAILERPAGVVLMGKGGGDIRSALGVVLLKLADNGTQSALFLIEDCAGGNGMAGRVQPPDLPEGFSYQIVATAGPDGTCDAVNGARLTDSITSFAPGAPLQDALSGLWTAGPGTAEVVYTVAPAPGQLAATALEETQVQSNPSLPQLRAATLEEPELPSSPAAQVDIVSVSPVPATVSPVRPAESVQGVSAADTASGDATVVFAPPSDAQIAALPRASGLPEPSIIIGIITETRASFSTIDDEQGEVTTNEITFENVAARRALQESDPGLFQQLVFGGAFDPPPALLERVIQTELARMACYTSTIDGIWGRGSRGSVTRFFNEIQGVTPVTTEPTMELFHQIISQPEVLCPAPVVRAQPRQPARPANNTPAPAPEPAPQPQRRNRGGNSTGFVGGVFR